MSWSPRNLFNLYQRCIGPGRADTRFTESSQTLFQQRWISKRLLRAYHGDYINEHIFKRWYLPATIPDVRPKRNFKQEDEAIGLARWARKDKPADAAAKERGREAEEKTLAPVGSLMFTELERRIDVVIFRACLATSVYEARRLVIHGDVLLNGKKHQNANTRLAPGDMVSVDPKAIRFLQPRSEKPAKRHEDAEEAPEEDSAAASETTSSAGNELEASVTETDKGAKPWKKLKKDQGLTPFNLPDYASPWIFIPAYIEPSFATCSAIYLRHPTARPGYSEIPTPYDADGEVVRLSWEWYTRVRPRIRSKSQKAREPENRK